MADIQTIQSKIARREALMDKLKLEMKALRKQLKEASTADRKAAIREVRQLIRNFGITEADLYDQPVQAEPTEDAPF